MRPTTKNDILLDNLNEDEFKEALEGFSKMKRCY
jgi:hypothetical protein